MADEQSPARIEVAEDPRFQRWEWRLQRVGWGIMALFLVAGALGLLGPPGPLFEGTARDGPLEVSYHRIQRREAPTEVKLMVDSGGRREVNLRIARRLAEAVTVTSLVPQPTSTSATLEAYSLTFPVADGEALVVTVHLEFKRAGHIAGAVSLDDGHRVPISVWVWP